MKMKIYKRISQVGEFKNIWYSLGWYRQDGSVAVRLNWFWDRYLDGEVRKSVAVTVFPQVDESIVIDVKTLKDAFNLVKALGVDA